MDNLISDPSQTERPPWKVFDPYHFCCPPHVNSQIFTRPLSDGKTNIGSVFTRFTNLFFLSKKKIADPVPRLAGASSADTVSLGANLISCSQARNHFVYLFLVVFCGFYLFFTDSLYGARVMRKIALIKIRKTFTDVRE